MHILRDMAIFVIFATISKNRKLLSRYRFTPPLGIAALPPGDSSLPPHGWVSDPGVGNSPYKRGALVSAADLFGLVQRSSDEINSCSCCIYSEICGSRILTINSVIQRVASYSLCLLTV